MSGLGEFGDLSTLKAIANALGKVKVWSKGINAGGIAFRETADLPFRSVQAAIEGVTLATLGADPDAALDALGIEVGTYTPTITPSVNTDAVTAFPSFYIRIGSQVIVSLYCEPDATAVGFGFFDVSLPIPSPGLNSYGDELSGAGAHNNAYAVNIYGYPDLAVYRYYADVTSAGWVTSIFMYPVIP